MDGNHAQGHSAADPGRDDVRHSGWVDRLVELHVLADNGDSAADAAGRRWIAEDADARRVWEEVQRTCDQLRQAPPGE
ncbi:hypothetical protein [Pseudonocardia acidicola]|uniref:Uncharacterized protein n=1 Tax=Pseudonocardia acidicola TaxID=2724939 RepID=A0ABX1SCY8_9PSEU|nr:hypothetical protein [Pseudonocardia acidicola]NMH98397.1 hypothetical protein [Pseudonocardia acidicola]